MHDSIAISVWYNKHRKRKPRIPVSNPTSHEYKKSIFYNDHSTEITFCNLIQQQHNWLDELRIIFILTIRIFKSYIYKTSISKTSQRQSLIGLSVHASTRKMTRTASNNKFKSVAIFAILNSLASKYSINTN